MKLTHTRYLKRKSGMTLLELTVVILVLLSLISILFIGARAWKKGADRAGCILNIRNFQQATRSYANFNQLNPGDTCPTLASVIIGTGLFMETAPVCPTAGTYSGTAAVVIPAVGTVALTCSKSAAPDSHAPTAAQHVAEW
ncbi:MAG: prepilin-type N-terminal cleavage/methylation domain-containing protein [Verrucomicrobia bacterium]|nr:MAG: prepilin-type N-terminal cleavage/methylation domain-containing protein [Verrucomicrobiota bacterium]